MNKGEKMKMLKDQIIFFDEQGTKHLEKSLEYEKKMNEELAEVERFALFSRAICNHLKYLKGVSE